MSPDGVARRRLAPDRRLPRPERAHARARRRRPRRRRRASSSARASPASTLRDGRVARGRHRPRHDRSRVVVIAGGMYTPEIGALAGVTRPDRADGAPVPGHQGVRAARSRDAADAARSRQARVLPRRRSTACSWAATSATRRRGRSTACPRDFNNQLLPEDWDRFAPLIGERARAGAGDGDAPRSRALVNGPEAFTPDDEFILGETDVPRLLRRGRLLRARHRRRRRHRPGDGRVDPRRRAVVRPVEHGHPPLRRASTAAALHAGPHRRGLRDLLRHPLPERGAQRRAAAAASRPPTRASPSSAPRSARSRGWERPNWFEPERGARRRGAAAARLGRRALVAGDRRRGARACRDAAGALRRDVASPRSRSSGPGARGVPASGCAPTTSTAPSARSTYTQMLNRARRHRVRLHRHPAGRATASCIVTGTAFGSHDLGWIRAPPAGGRLASRVRDVTSALGVLRPVGPAGARRSCSRSRTTTSSNDGVPVPDARARSPSATCRCSRAARHLRRRAGLGALLPDRVRRSALWDALWEAGARARPGRRRLPRDRRAAAREGLPRLGRATSRPRTTPYEAGLGFAVQARQGGGFIGRDALVRGAGGRRRAERLRCLVLDDPRVGRARLEPVRVDGEIVGRVTSGGYGFAVERSIAYAYLPAAAAARCRCRTRSRRGRCRRIVSRGGRRGAGLGTRAVTAVSAPSSAPRSRSGRPADAAAAAAVVDAGPEPAAGVWLGGSPGWPAPSAAPGGAQRIDRGDRSCGWRRRRTCPPWPPCARAGARASAAAR